MTMPNQALQRLEQFGKLRKEFAAGKGIAGCDTETAGAVESTTPRPSSTLRSAATEDGRPGCNRGVPPAGSLSFRRQATSRA